MADAEMAHDEIVVPHDDDGRPFNELRENGLLWLINRTIFHPRGFSLGFVVETSEETGEETSLGWSILGNGSESFTFLDEQDQVHFAHVEKFFAELRKS